MYTNCCLGVLQTNLTNQRLSTLYSTKVLFLYKRQQTWLHAKCVSNHTTNNAEHASGSHMFNRTWLTSACPQPPSYMLNCTLDVFFLLFFLLRVITRRRSVHLIIVLQNRPSSQHVISIVLAQHWKHVWDVDPPLWRLGKSNIGVLRSFVDEVRNNFTSFSLTPFSQLCFSPSSALSVHENRPKRLR